jgi:HlyD family secretion protein
MSPILRRLLFWAVPALLVAGGLALAFRPQPLAVDFARAERGELVVSVAEEGRTRVRDVFVVSAPLRGRVRRIDLEEGDAVEADETVVAEIEPTDPEFLDIRSEAEARAAVATARAAVALAEAELEEARAELDFAEAEVARIRRLRESNTVSVRVLEDAERLFRTRKAAVATAEANLEMRRSELEAAEVRLLRPPEARARAGGCPCITIRAPVSGRVLRVLQESETVVAAGTPLLEIGDPRDLEIVADFLSSDAVRIEPGMEVVIEQWGGEGTLSGTVARVEPYGFTKVSALGIEEQRVNVVIAFAGPEARRRRLGHGFEVEVRVILAEAEDALKVPLTALFREDGDWAVFAVEDGLAALRRVELGRRNDLEAEIVSGLAAGDTIVRYPSDEVAEGVALEAR